MIASSNASPLCRGRVGVASRKSEGGIVGELHQELAGLYRELARNGADISMLSAINAAGRLRGELEREENELRSRIRKLRAEIDACLD